MRTMCQIQKLITGVVATINDPVAGDSQNENNLSNSKLMDTFRSTSVEVLRSAIHPCLYVLVSLGGDSLA